MRYIFDGTKKIPHPEERSKGASRRTRRADPACADGLSEAQAVSALFSWFAARLRRFRHPASGRSDRAGRAIAVVVAHPVAQIAPWAGLVPALRHNVEIAVLVKQILAAPPVGRIGAKNAAIGVLGEDAA